MKRYDVERAKPHVLAKVGKRGPRVNKYRENTYFLNHDLPRYRARWGKSPSGVKVRFEVREARFK